jgi:hypothetical protein
MVGHGERGGSAGIEGGMIWYGAPQHLCEGDLVLEYGLGTGKFIGKI